MYIHMFICIFSFRLRYEGHYVDWNPIYDKYLYFIVLFICESDVFDISRKVHGSVALFYKLTLGV